MPLFLADNFPPARADRHEEKKLWVSKSLAPVQEYFVREEDPPTAPTQHRLRPKGEKVESLMCEIHSACLVLSLPAPETVLSLARTSPGCLRKLLGQKRAVKSRHTVPKPEAGAAIKVKNEYEEAVGYESYGLVKRSRLK